jgi:hypothetical protein
VLSQNFEDWPVVDPLPSYGRGRELPGGRHRSLIYGSNLTDVIITGLYIQRITFFVLCTIHVGLLM